MADQPDTALDREYAETAARVRRFLVSEYELEAALPSSSDYPPVKNDWRAVWRVHVPTPSGGAALLIALPKTFPDELPTVYLPGDVKEKDSGRTIPHLNGEREFCTFDRNEVRVNADNPEGIVVAVIERALKLMGEGVAGANRAEYLDEFEAYWEQGASLLALSLVGPSDEAKTVAGVTLSPPWKGRAVLFAGEESEARRWLASVGYRRETKSQPVLYLPLKDFGLPPYPATNGELYDRLRECDPEALRRLLGFLRRHPRPTCVLFSAPAGGGRRAMGAWWHPKFAHQVYRGVKGGRRQSNVIGGFPAGSHPADVELSMKYRAEKLTRAKVERVDQARLAERTAGAAPRVFEHPINVVGCGSVGSLAAARLAETGFVDRLRLVDFDRLGVENPGRHYCGMEDVGEYKTVATAGKIQRHFPHVRCETRESDVLNLLRTSPAALVPASLTLVCVGVLPVERRLNRIALSETGLATPHCYVWVEPHLYGGHALFVRRGAGGCFECAFDEAFLFERRVVRDPRGFSMREAGCRSNYLPYSGLDANAFVSGVIRFILGAVDSPENQAFSWAGDLEAARREGVALCPEWAGAPPFTSAVRKLAPKPSCPVCAA
ncbi:MAG: ThiF family adenylyltransferase [Acidobacteriota bacterium]|nr:ThiF family adenylyltransferase [Acidobacteriota bacterium]